MGSYCKGDGHGSVFLGNTYHKSYGPQRNTVSYNAHGFTAIRNKFRHMCFFYHAGHSALCNFQTSSDSHYWASTAKYGLQYMCAKVDATEFQVKLQARNGVHPSKYAMIAARISASDSNTNDMSATMRATCTAIGGLYGGW